MITAGSESRRTGLPGAVLIGASLIGIALQDSGTDGDAYDGPEDWDRRALEPDWGNDAPGRLVVPQKMLPILGAPYSRPDRMEHPIEGTDLVLGVSSGGRARAYPIKMLGGPQREIINDRLGGQPFAVNW